MQSHTLPHTLAVTSFLCIVVAASFLTFVHSPVLAHAAQVYLPSSFNESSPIAGDGTSYSWTRTKDAYWNTSQGRVDSGQWDVAAHYPSADTPYQDLGTIEVGVNTTYDAKTGRYTYATDVATTIQNLGIPHETVVTTYPLHSYGPHQSQWGSADIHTKGYEDTYDIWTPKLISHKEHHLSVASYYPSARGQRMVDNMQKMVQKQRHFYHELATDSGLCNPYSFSNSRTNESADDLVVAQPNARPRPLSNTVLLLAAAGVVMSFAGAVISVVCLHTSCGGDQWAWIITGGIVGALGIVMLQISGASVAGYQIAAAAQAAVNAAAGEMRTITQATHDVNRGVDYASSSEASHVAPDIEAGFGIPAIYGVNY